MEEQLLFLRKNVANVKGVSDFTFTGPNSAIITDSYDYVETQIYIMVQLYFPRIFK